MNTDGRLSSSQESVSPGKLTEVESKNLILLEQLEKINSSVAGDKELQANTVKGLERLGDSLASMKVEIRKTEALGGRLEEVTLKQLSQEQEITRSTGRLNKVERDVVELANTELDTSQLRQEVEVLGGTLTNTRNTLAELLTKVDNLQSDGSTSGQAKIIICKEKEV